MRAAHYGWTHLLARKLCKYRGTAGTFNSRHITKRPVMRSDAYCSSSLERFVSMMTWFINDVDQRLRYAVLTCCISPMARCAFCVKSELRPFFRTVSLLTLRGHFPSHIFKSLDRCLVANTGMPALSVVEDLDVHVPGLSQWSLFFSAV